MKFLLTLLIFIYPLKSETKENALSGERYYLLSGKEVEEDNSFDIWDRYYRTSDSYIYGKGPSPFLSENFEYIQGAKVLDIGTGEGRNAVFLARKGYNVTGIDISKVALKKAVSLAKESKVKINPVYSSIENFKEKDESYDAILSFYFLSRKSKERIIRLIKPGGVLIIETYLETVIANKKIKLDNLSQSYFVKSQELLTMFPTMKVLKYEETISDEHRVSVILQKR